MVHTAFNCVSIIEKLPLKIEAIEVWGQRLLVGTTEGVLFIYDVQQSSGVAGVQLVDALKTFAKKPVTQLTVLDKYAILLSLSDNYIAVHELPSFQQRFQMAKTKGCHLFALDKTKSPPMLCVAIKKKLLIFVWEGTEFVELKELAIPDVARTLVWCGDSICIGFRKEYNLIHVQTGAMTELFPTGRSGNPIATLLPNEQLLLGRDNISIFIGFDGKPTRKYGLSWAEPPTVLGYSYPYVIAVLPKNVEVRTVSGTQSLVQTLTIKAPRFLAIKDGDIYIAASNHVWRLAAVPMMNQVDQLVKDKDYEEALALCENIPDSDEHKSSKVKNIKILYTHHLFFLGQFDRAMEYFQELDCEPLQVIGLYPNLLPRDIRAKYSYPMDVSDANNLATPALDKALHALTKYLLRMRTETKEINLIGLEDDYQAVVDMNVIIDTTLLKAYVKISDKDLLDLLNKPNFCHIKESEKSLLNNKRFKELVLLYKGKGLHRNALELLSKLGQDKEQKMSTMFGPQETVQYLRFLGRNNLDLVLEFSKWALQQSAEEALQIFTENRSEENQLPPAKVMEHLKGYSTNQVTPFLEHIIENCKEKGPEFHNELIFNYHETIMYLRKMDPEYAKQATTARVKAGTEQGLLGTTRKKLIIFLEESQYYNPEKMLSRFPFDDLYEERAILLSRIGQHDKALNIYAHKLKDIEMAERYCERHYNSEKEESRDVYLSLLKVYLKPPEEQPMVEPALALLNKHYTRIDLPKALELLPADISVNKLFGVFQAKLRDNSKNRRNNQVIKNLLKSENFQIREQQIRTRSRVIRITDDKMCPVCNKRIGLSAFAFYPSGLIVHYHCWSKMA